VLVRVVSYFKLYGLAVTPKLTKLVRVSSDFFRGYKNDLKITPPPAYQYLASQWLNACGLLPSTRTKAKTFSRWFRLSQVPSQPPALVPVKIIQDDAVSAFGSLRLQLRQGWIDRLSNSSDRDHVSKFLPDSLNGLTKMLSALTRREAIFVGEGGASCRIRIRKLLSEQLPDSNDIKFAKGWSKNAINKEDLTAIVDRRCVEKD